MKAGAATRPSATAGDAVERIDASARAAEPGTPPAGRARAGSCRRGPHPRRARHPWLLRACGEPAGGVPGSAARAGTGRRVRFAAAILLAIVPLLSGCAIFGGGQRGVPIEQRPTPKQPAAGDTVAVERIQVEPVVQEDQRAQLMAKVVADTTEAGAAVRRCLRRKLLPEQEMTIESTLNFLREARDQLELGELSRAEQSARKAKALAASLRCS